MGGCMPDAAALRDEFQVSCRLVSDGWVWGQAGGVVKRRSCYIDIVPYVNPYPRWGMLQQHHDGKLQVLKESLGIQK